MRLTPLECDRLDVEDGFANVPELLVDQMRQRMNRRRLRRPRDNQRRSPVPADESDPRQSHRCLATWSAKSTRAGCFDAKLRRQRPCNVPICDGGKAMRWSAIEPVSVSVLSMTYSRFIFFESFAHAPAVGEMPRIPQARRHRGT